MFFKLLVTLAGQKTNRHLLSGVVTVDGLPAQRRITVFDKKTHSTIASTWSKADTGEWQISHINEYPERGLFVIAFDDTGNHNAEIADFISQVAE